MVQIYVIFLYLFSVQNCIMPVMKTNAECIGPDPELKPLIYKGFKIGVQPFFLNEIVLGNGTQFKIIPPVIK